MNPDPFLAMLAPSRGEKILDIGAGKGQVAEMVLRASQGAEVYAVEPNEKRVASMKKDFPAIRSSIAGAESLPFPDAHFDKVYATMALHHFSDLDKALQQVTRVLKPGGSFVVLEVEPGSAKGTVFRLLGRIMGERMSLMTEQQLSARLGSFKDLKVTGSAKAGSGYLVRAARV